MRDIFTEIRKKGKRPHWLAEGIYEELGRWWNTPEYIKKREQNKINRAGDHGGIGSSLHTGGSVPHTEHRRRLKALLGREPTPLEIHTHTHQHQGAERRWVDERSRKAADDYVQFRESQPQTGEGSSCGSVSSYADFQAWSKVVGGKAKGRVYGLGSQASAYDQSYTSATVPQSHDTSQQDRRLDERMDALTKNIVEELSEKQSVQIADAVKTIQSSLMKTMKKFFKSTQKTKGKGKERAPTPEPESEPEMDTSETASDD